MMDFPKALNPTQGQLSGNQDPNSPTPGQCPMPPENGSVYYTPAPQAFAGGLPGLTRERLGLAPVAGAPAAGVPASSPMADNDVDDNLIRY